MRGGKQFKLLSTWIESSEVAFGFPSAYSPRMASEQRQVSRQALGEACRLAGRADLLLTEAETFQVLFPAFLTAELWACDPV